MPASEFVMESMSEYVPGRIIGAQITRRAENPTPDEKFGEPLAEKLFSEHARIDGRTDIPLANSEVEAIVAKAVGIAQHLNQAELRVAHLLIAMTLTEDGRRRLEECPDLNLSLIRDACWQELKSFFRLPNTTPSIVVSTELKEVMSDAFGLTLKRNILNQPLQVEDIITTITKSPYNEKFGNVLYGDVQKTIADETLDVAKAILRDAGYYQPVVVKEIGNVAALIDRQSRSLNEISILIDKESGIGRDLYQAILQSNRDILTQQENIEGRVRTTKRLVAILVILSGLFAASIILAGLQFILKIL